MVSASAGLWTSVAMKTPKPAPSAPRPTSKSAATALARAIPPIREWTARPMTAGPHRIAPGECE